MCRYASASASLLIYPTFCLTSLSHFLSSVLPVRSRPNATLGGNSTFRNVSPLFDSNASLMRACVRAWRGSKQTPSARDGVFAHFARLHGVHHACMRAGVNAHMCKDTFQRIQQEASQGQTPGVWRAHTLTFVSAAALFYARSNVHDLLRRSNESSAHRRS